MLLGGRWWHRLCRWLGFRRRRSTPRMFDSIEWAKLVRQRLRRDRGHGRHS
ncbi:hypothetical protein LCGC14_0354940 [marine sediment metagenome]|uniref:Uncharacterized protein n=1 Tax=marine sediment metagenome TaxID=412755 RepID=A0A0F9TFA2_9ZZZZ